MADTRRCETIRLDVAGPVARLTFDRPEALVCDYRIAREDARIGLPAVQECLIPSMALERCLGSEEHRAAMAALRARRQPRGGSPARRGPGRRSSA